VVFRFNATPGQPFTEQSEVKDYIYADNGQPIVNQTGSSSSIGRSYQRISSSNNELLSMQIESRTLTTVSSILQKTSIYL
jgi:hypothetical protein